MILRAFRIDGGLKTVTFFWGTTTVTVEIHTYAAPLDIAWDIEAYLKEQGYMYYPSNVMHLTYLHPDFGKG